MAAQRGGKAAGAAAAAGASHDALAVDDGEWGWKSRKRDVTLSGHVIPVGLCCMYEMSQPKVGVAVVELTNNVPVRLSYSSEELPAGH